MQSLLSRARVRPQRKTTRARTDREKKSAGEYLVGGNLPPGAAGQGKLKKSVGFVLADQRSWVIPPKKCRNPIKKYLTVFILL
jgi:hypothetical protein